VAHRNVYGCKSLFRSDAKLHGGTETVICTRLLSRDLLALSIANDAASGVASGCGGVVALQRDCFS